MPVLVPAFLARRVMRPGSRRMAIESPTAIASSRFRFWRGCTTNIAWNLWPRESCYVCAARVIAEHSLLQKPVVESLMVSLVVVVLDLRSREKAHVVLAERDHTIETFLFIERTNRSAYALRVGLLGGMGWHSLIRMWAINL